jgi:hypothetical protein
LDGKRPTVTVQAGYSKHRREDVLALRPDTAADLRDLLARKLPDAPAFAVPADRHESAAMFRADLEAVGLKYVDAAGRYADFHALRHTCGSLLAASGCHPKVAQSIMRHCTIDLTMSRYTHVFAGQEADAVASLPDLGKPAAGAAKATGTDGRTVEPDATDGPRAAGHAPAPSGSPRPADADGEEARKNSARFSALLRTFPRAAMHPDAPEAQGRELAENTGKSTQTSVFSGPEAVLAGVAELADAQDSKSGVKFPQGVENTMGCDDSRNQLGAFLGVLAARLAPAVPDLAAVLAAWPALPDALKAGIAAMVKAAGGNERPASR